MRSLISRAIAYRALLETESLRRMLGAHRHGGWPYCSDDQGDVLFQLAGSVDDQDALQVGFATGSTAAYILSGLRSGCLTSIDNDQDHFHRAGEALVNTLGLAVRHRLVEQDSVRALPALFETGARFGLVFLDGWKTFDRLWVDTFYSAQMLSSGGYIVLDDSRMPAVRKSASLLRRYYAFRDIDSYESVGGRRLRLRHLLTTGSTHRPYVILQKTMDITETDAGRCYDFWRPF